MNKTKIQYADTGYFSGLMLDYLGGKETLKPFYNKTLSIQGFEKQFAEKQFSSENRTILYNSLANQYASLNKSTELSQNLALLKQKNTYTVTTGHQLNLFTGPLYFIYKIVSTINLAKQLSDKFPGKNVVPVFWMATEDHDFEEINHFNLFGSKIEINKSESGAVGRMNLDGVAQVFDQLKEALAGRTGLENIIDKIENAYRSENTFTSAIRELVNELFGAHGLIIVDGDDIELKRIFSPLVKNELIERENFNAINSSSEKLLELGYKKQVNPREINLFYLTDELRSRIVFEDAVYKVLETTLQFTEAEILAELENHPERFSPNAVMRPLYQETILPNLAYIGGGGELAYWFQLKEMFNNNQTAFPVLVLRNSAVIVDKGTQKKITKLGYDYTTIFKKEEELIKEFVNTSNSVDLSIEKNALNEIYASLSTKVQTIDASLEGAVKAELQKSLKSIEIIDKKLIKAIKSKEEVNINQIRAIKAKLFPNGSLQERKDNFLYAQLLLGDNFVEDLMTCLDPFEQEFIVLSV